MSNFDNAERIFPYLAQEVREILLTAPEVEFATISANGHPINNPLFHYFGDNGQTIDVIRRKRNGLSAIPTSAFCLHLA
jgi:hypothetical protein